MNKELYAQIKAKNFLRLLGLLAIANFSSFIVQDDRFTIAVLAPSIILFGCGWTEASKQYDPWEGMLD